MVGLSVRRAAARLVYPIRLSLSIKDVVPDGERDVDVGLTTDVGLNGQSVPSACARLLPVCLAVIASARSARRPCFYILSLTRHPVKTPHIALAHRYLLARDSTAIRASAQTDLGSFISAIRYLRRLLRERTP
jgi:hypothetical protein